MQKNRQIAIILIVVMLLGLLAGCGKETESTPADTSKDTTAAAPQDSNPAEEGEPEASAAEEEDVTESEELVTNIFGEDETYENEEFGFGFAPDGWSFYDDETLKAQTDANYVMAAANSAGETVSVAIEDTPQEYKGLNEEELYFLLLMTEQPKLQELGLPDADIEVSTTQFLGKDCSALHTTLGSFGVEQKRIYLVQEEKTCVITVTSVDEDTVDTIMGLFHQL